MIKTKIAAAAAALAVSATLAAAPAMASTMSSLQGVQAQEMSVEELQAVTGELNAYDIAAALYAQAAKYATTAPRLSASLKSLADKTLANAVQINAAFAKLGILTACQTCK